MTGDIKIRKPEDIVIPQPATRLPPAKARRVMLSDIPLHSHPEQKTEPAPQPDPEPASTLPYPGNKPPDILAVVAETEPEKRGPGRPPKK